MTVQYSVEKEFIAPPQTNESYPQFNLTINSPWKTCAVLIAKFGLEYDSICSGFCLDVVPNWLDLVLQTCCGRKTNKFNCVCEPPPTIMIKTWGWAENRRRWFSFTKNQTIMWNMIFSRQTVCLYSIYVFLLATDEPNPTAYSAFTCGISSEVWKKKPSQNKLY